MFKTLLLLTLLLPLICYPDVATIQNNIEKLSNIKGKAYTENIASIIEKYSLIYNIDWRIVVAIFKTESNFQQDAVNYHSRDFGIGQINALNMKHYKFDLGKQMTDIDYAIRNTFIILSLLKDKYDTNSKSYRQWFTRYHSFNWIYRKQYYEKLERYLKILKYNKE